MAAHRKFADAVSPLLPLLAPALASAHLSHIQIALPSLTTATRTFSSSPCCAARLHSGDSEFAHLDPYRELGVEKSASQGDIQKAYRALLFSLHPDRHQSTADTDPFPPATPTHGNLRRSISGHRHKRPSTAGADKDRLLRVLAAYDILRNPDKRRKHDQAVEWRVNWNGDYVMCRPGEDGFGPPHRRRTRPPTGGMHYEAGGAWEDPFPGTYGSAAAADEHPTWAPPPFIEKSTSMGIVVLYLIAVGGYFVWDFTQWTERNRKHDLDFPLPQPRYLRTSSSGTPTPSLPPRPRLTESAPPESQIAAYLDRINNGKEGYGRPSEVAVRNRWRWNGRGEVNGEDV
ncbi:DnaJ-domain-containing protein [Gonapodya prolifera JEL478]|uniref:DnaJ-domain-containing protein n=1 Tax=Gonapodya prolifera (strain JEL478) TaxID=1344416 RepID=A0A139AMJ8_GONPJ|nr:DnaJ-domain-containing protein [Gonapodya prolifera JEL478]|eukprot:KXS17992.1 DnaJ-domain-containing protein [Gonapodya prolifera JEL478]